MNTPKATQSTKKKLIDGAMRVLEAEGVSGTTTRKIAEAAGVRLATLHYHFADKNALLFAVLEEITLLMEDFLVNEVKPANSLEQCIAELVWALWRLVRRTRELQIVQFELTMYAVRRPDTAWLAQRQYDAYIQKYERILDSHKESELTRRQSRQLAQFLLAGFDGILVQELAMPNETRSKEALHYLIMTAQHLAKQLPKE